LLLLTGCPGGGDDGVGGACGTGFDPDTGTVGDFGATAAAQKVEAMLHASADLYAAASATEMETLAACTAMATDLGIPAGELQPAAGELAVTKACTRVKTEIDAIIKTLPVGVALGISVTPAQCTVDLNVAASCAAECDASITGNAMVECKGELHGSCSATCSGKCSVMGNVSCNASCSGTCSGTCTGKCYGTCNGTCAVKDSMGNCAGSCVGTCDGTCDANCQGTCMGTCTSTVTGSCSGECYGNCDATWTAECNGEANVMANVECKAACDARASAKATCDPPTVTIVAMHVSDSTKDAKLQALINTLKTNYPKLLRVQQREEERGRRRLANRRPLQLRLPQHDPVRKQRRVARRLRRRGPGGHRSFSARADGALHDRLRRRCESEAPRHPRGRATARRGAGGSGAAGPADADARIRRDQGRPRAGRVGLADPYVARHAKLMNDIRARAGALPTTQKMPVQVWRFGTDLTLVTLGGEVVVDYALRLRREHPDDHVWPVGYANDVFGYVPSRRVLQEGGYEGGDSMIYYGRPAPFTPAVEELIMGEVERLLES
jgi:hypothetical protein